MTQRLVQFDNAEARPTPLLLLADLRMIDPQVELVYVGEGRWWLGAIKPNDERRRKGELIAKQMDSLPIEHQQLPTIQRNKMLARLLIQGFARIEEYFAPGDPSGDVIARRGSPDEYHCLMVCDFQERDFCFRSEEQRRANEAQMIDQVTGAEEKRASDANFRDYILNDGRDHWHRQARDRKQFGRGGMTGGRGSGLILTGV